MAAVGEIVLLSMMRESGLAFLKIPPYDPHTFLECSELGNMATKILADLATSLTYFLKLMLCFLVSASLLLSTSKAKT
jgi:hypothetical protein